MMLTLVRVGVEAVEGGAHGLSTALHVRLNDQVEIYDFAGLDSRRDVLQRPMPPLDLLGTPPLFDHLAGRPFVRHDGKRVPRVGQATDAEYLNGGRRASLLDTLPAVIEHGADTSF